MDLNELLHAHQVEVMHASAAGDLARQQYHYEKVAQFARQIHDLRDVGYQQSPLEPSAASDTISYASYTGGTVSDQRRNPLTVWEGEGGALASLAARTATGPVPFVNRQYYVGSQVFTDLGEAAAEHARLADLDDESGALMAGADQSTP